MLYKNTNAMVPLPDGDTDFFDMVARSLQEDSLAPYLFIDYMLRTYIDQIKLRVSN